MMMLPLLGVVAVLLVVLLTSIAVVRRDTFQSSSMTTSSMYPPIYSTDIEVYDRGGYAVVQPRLPVQQEKHASDPFGPFEPAGYPRPAGVLRASQHGDLGCSSSSRSSRSSIRSLVAECTYSAGSGYVCGSAKTHT
jgi:hypothetical protein